MLLVDLLKNYAFMTKIFIEWNILLLRKIKTMVSHPETSLIYSSNDIKNLLNFFPIIVDFSTIEYLNRKVAD